MKTRFLPPQLATLTGQVFSNKDWIFEEKFDGIRCIAVRKNGKISLYSRNRKSLNRDFPEIVKSLEQRGKNFVADGEIVTFVDRVSSFSKLQQRKKEKLTVYFQVFDLLMWDEEDFRTLPQTTRKKKLKSLFPFSSRVRYTPHVEEKGEAELKKSCKKGLEGVIAKQKDAPYLGKRTRNWLKLKCSNGQELVIGGFTDPKGSRIGFGALLVGYYDKGKLLYAGRVGTGYDDDLLKSLGAKLRRLERDSSPFSTTPKGKDVHFVRPTLVCAVGFTEWTRDGKLRHPRFLGLRKDKPAKRVKREQS